MAAGAAGGAGVGGVAEVPALGGADGEQLVLAQAVLGEPGGAVLGDDRTHVGDALQAGRGGEPGPRLLAVLEEILLPEGTAAEHARAAALHRHADLLEVVGI